MYPYYDTLSTTVVSEYYINDLSTVLTSIGGNLGLFLGYSAMTLLLALVELVKLSWKKYDSNTHTTSKRKK